MSSRQVGKSWSLAFLSVYKALSKRNGLSLCISTGARSANELIKKCEQMAYAANVLSNGALSYTASADTIKFANGCRVISLPSGNATALRGWSSQCILIDECAFIDRPNDVYSAIVPTLTRDKEAELVVASTPAGKKGLFWDLWNNADESWHKQCTTILDAKSQGLDVDVDALRKMTIDPEMFDIEYMCKFADSYSDFIDLSLIDYYDELPKDVTARYMGMDVGSTSDRTAIVTLAQSGDTYFLQDIVILHKSSYEN